MARQLRDGVWWIDGTGVNAYLLESEGRLTLVDAGMAFDAGRIAAAIRDAGYGPADLDRILLTHYDLDHVGTLGRLDTDAPIHVGAADAPFLVGEKRPGWRSVKELTQLVTTPFCPTVSDDRVRRVEDGDRIGGFEAIHAPGHTPGHTVYVHSSGNAAFLGDLVIEWNGSLRPAPWPLCYDRAGSEESILRVADRAPAFEAAGMGHGTPFERGGRERLEELADTLRR